MDDGHRAVGPSTRDVWRRGTATLGLGVLVASLLTLVPSPAHTAQIEAWWLWAQAIPSDGYSEGGEVLQMPDGSLVVAGGYQGNAYFSSTVLTPEAAPRPSVVITGSRDGKRIEVSGRTTGFGMGGTLRPWTRFPGQSAYSEGAATILVSMDGTFEWGRKTGKRVLVYVQTPDGSPRSNTVTIPTS